MPVYIEGLNRTVRGLQQLGVEVDDLKDTMQSIAREGAVAAAGYAPHRSGRLAASIRPNRAKGKAVIIAGNARRVPYAGPINYGWARRRIKAKQFMQRADRAIEPRALTLLEAGIDEAIRKADLA